MRRKWRENGWPDLSDGRLTGGLFGDDSLQLIEGLRDGQRVHFLAQSLAGFQGRFEVVTGNLDRERIGDHLSGALVVLNPRRARQDDPDGMAIDQKLDIDCVGVPRGDGDDQSLVEAVDFFPGPAVEHVEVLIHGLEKLYRSGKGGANRGGLRLHGVDVNYDE